MFLRLFSRVVVRRRPVVRFATECCLLEERVLLSAAGSGVAAEVADVETKVGRRAKAGPDVNPADMIGAWSATYREASNGFLSFEMNDGRLIANFTDTVYLGGSGQVRIKGDKLNFKFKTLTIPIPGRAVFKLQLSAPGELEGRVKVRYFDEAASDGFSGDFRATKDPIP